MARAGRRHKRPDFGLIETSSRARQNGVWSESTLTTGRPPFVPNCRRASMIRLPLCFFRAARIFDNGIPRALDVTRAARVAASAAICCSFCRMRSKRSLTSSPAMSSVASGSNSEHHADRRQEFCLGGVSRDRRLFLLSCLTRCEPRPSRHRRRWPAGFGPPAMNRSAAGKRS